MLFLPPPPTSQNTDRLEGGLFLLGLVGFTIQSNHVGKASYSFRSNYGWNKDTVCSLGFIWVLQFPPTANPRITHGNVWGSAGLNGVRYFDTDTLQRASQQICNWSVPRHVSSVAVRLEEKFSISVCQTKRMRPSVRKMWRGSWDRSWREWPSSTRTM